MGWRQIFHLSKEKRPIILQGLDKPELYAGKVKDVGEPAEQSIQCISCNAALTFSDEDLLHGSKPRNRPLYVSSYIRGQKVNIILIDGGSGFNLMLKATMKELGNTVDELSSSRTVIRGFNLNGERAIGMIRVNISMGDLSSETLFHVIEAKTSFKKINRDAKPFSKADSFFVDAKFFQENGTSSEFMPTIISSTTISSTGKGGYDFTKPTLLGKVVEVEPYGLNKTQQELFKQEGSFIETKVWLGYKSPTPVKISARRNRTTTSSQHITVEEAQENEAEDIKRPSTSSVFDKISPPAQRARPYVFDRLGRPSPTTNHLSVFTRLDKRVASELKSLTPPPCTSKKGALSDRLGVHSNTVFTRLGASNNDNGKTLLCSTSVEKNDEEVNISDDLRSAILSRMKHLEIVTSYHITGEEIPDDNEEVETDKAPETLEDGVQSTVDDLKELNLGTDEDPCPIYVSALLTKEEEEEYYKLLVEYKDVFAWSYKEMPGLSPKIAVHRLTIRKGISPRKQSQRHFRTELIPKIEKEVNKLIEARFIREVRYPSWIANIVPVRKKNGQLRLCVDFRDLNDAYPKDDFPRIKKQRHFAHQKGYFAVPLGLKNFGAPYQQAMQKIFDDMLHKTIECYVDDVVVKSKKRENYVKDIRAVFERLRKCQLNMNPLKCAFGVTSRKFLGFVVRHRGIEINQIKNQSYPRNARTKDVEGAARAAGIFGIHSMYKEVPGQRTSIGGTDSRKPLILYIAAKERSLGAMGAKEIKEGKERALYYLSRTLVGAELNYSPIEKICLALVFAIQKLRHYMYAHTIHAVSKASPIKYKLSLPILSGRLAKWTVLLKQYDLVFVSQKAVKGQVIVHFFADHPVPAEWELSEELPGEEIFYVDILPPWQMYFDGAARQDGAGAGVVFIFRKTM
ncbi:uncharacterized protein LOC141631058 [Silene latifolia]|uniref:uncharacterized protein LOC141631058 n=1 Tax=Silene latifolia TaxID=37657 RepID=UPI003D7772E1